MAPGSTTITAKSTDGNLVTATFGISVSEPDNSVAVTAIQVTGQTDMTVGSTQALTTTVSPADATDKALTWASSDGTIATVDDGLVTALTIGSITITATADDGSGILGSIKVTVTSKSTVLSTGRNNTSLTIKPNPAVDYLDLNYPTTFNGVSFKMIDLHGKVVFSGILDKPTKLDVSSLNRGLYLLKVGQKGEFPIQKIILD